MYKMKSKTNPHPNDLLNKDQSFFSPGDPNRRFKRK